ncbi:MAG: hypothetical protein JSS86_22635, partial [Cyanobacteria bacterium SZAS LIN-2]|nr:hypothetical protein [Cyanobacteria bacterium SZAS LIN-2]
MPSDTEITAYLGHVISPLSEKEYLDYRGGALLVSSAGKILAVGPWEELQKSALVRGAGSLKVVDYGERLILPGLVDLHLHLPQVTQTGRSGEHL